MCQHNLFITGYENVTFTEMYTRQPRRFVGSKRAFEQTGTSLVVGIMKAAMSDYLMKIVNRSILVINISITNIASVSYLKIDYF